MPILVGRLRCRIEVGIAIEQQNREAMCSEFSYHGGDDRVVGLRSAGVDAQRGVVGL